jgi:hypothetical protein
MSESIIRIFRHANRYPLKNIGKAQTFPVGELTPQGIQNAIASKAYFNDLDKYNTTFICSNIPRTIATSYYIAHPNPKPIQYQAMADYLADKYKLIQYDIAYDAFFRGYYPELAPSINTLLMPVYKEHTFEMRKRLDKYQSYYQAAFNLNLNSCSLNDLYYIADYFISMPSQSMRKEDLAIMREGLPNMNTIYKLVFRNMLVRKIANHFIFKYILKFFEQPPGNMLMVATHDYNIIAIVSALGFQPVRDPYYLSCITIKSSGDRVNVGYDDGEESYTLFDGSKDDFQYILKKGMFSGDLEFIRNTGNLKYISDPHLINSLTKVVQVE